MEFYPTLRRSVNDTFTKIPFLKKSYELIVNLPSVFLLLH